MLLHIMYQTCHWLGSSTPVGRAVIECPIYPSLATIMLDWCLLPMSNGAVQDLYLLVPCANAEQ